MRFRRLTPTSSRPSEVPDEVLRDLPGLFDGHQLGMSNRCQQQNSTDAHD